MSIHVDQHHNNLTIIFTKATFPFLKQLPPPIVMWGFELEIFDVFAVKGGNR